MSATGEIMALTVNRQEGQMIGAMFGIIGLFTAIAIVFVVYGVRQR